MITLLEILAASSLIFWWLPAREASGISDQFIEDYCFINGLLKLFNFFFSMYFFLI